MEALKAAVKIPFLAVAFLYDSEAVPLYGDL